MKKIKFVDVYQEYEVEIPRVNEKMKYGYAEKIIRNFLNSEFTLVKLIFDPYKYPPVSLRQALSNVRYRKGLKNDFSISCRGNDIYLIKGETKWHKEKLVGS